MRTFKLIAGLSFLLLMVACQDKKRSSQIEVAENESKYVVLAYVTSWGESTPDPACLTHILIMRSGMLQIISKEYV
jgi:chitinase